MKLCSLLTLLAIIIGGLIGCQNQPLHEEDIRLMAQLQCEARNLKEERFRIANEFRFRNDSLLKMNIPLTDIQKQEEDSVRQILTARTGEVAVRLTRTMDSLFEVHYPSVELRQQFDEAVEKKMAEMCPE